MALLPMENVPVRCVLTAHRKNAAIHSIHVLFCTFKSAFYFGSDAENR